MGISLSGLSLNLWGTGAGQSRRPVDPVQPLQNLRRGEEAQASHVTGGEESVQKSSSFDRWEPEQCETCENRKYQDGSDDPGVSFQTPTKLSPDQAATAVRGHEMEHVSREQDKARQTGREVVSQAVSIHTDICPECHRVYVSGGTTRTVTRNASDLASLFQQPEEAQKGAFVDVLA